MKNSAIQGWLYAAGSVLFLAQPLSGTATAGSLAIDHISMTVGGPELSIISKPGATNQIQTLTDLAQTNWVVLTNLVVAQSPYLFLDSRTSAGPQRFYRVLDPSGGTVSTPPGMVLIPAGAFDMGDTFNEGAPYEVPVHTVYVSAFYLAKFEVTKALWDQVLAWSVTNGYAFDNLGAGKAPK